MKAGIVGAGISGLATARAILAPADETIACRCEEVTAGAVLV